MNGEQLGSPAAAILARRASRAALPERLQEQAPYDSSDDEWDPEEDEGGEQEPHARRPRPPLKGGAKYNIRQGSVS